MYIYQTKNNISLIGFMGSGKSSTGKFLAEQLDKILISTDDLIEEREGVFIADIFKNKGEAYFRNVEKKVIQKACTEKDVVIDCGGGVVLSPENMLCLKKTGMVIYLSVSPEVIYERIKHKKHRPLMNVENPQKQISDLLKQRKYLYEQAEYTFNTDGKTPVEVGEEILKLYQIHLLRTPT